MKRQFVWILLLCLLLTGCTQGIPPETTEKPEIQVQYPPALEDGFAICTDLIDVVMSPASNYAGFDMYILSHEPLTPEDISVQIEGLADLEVYLGEISMEEYWTGQEKMEAYNWSCPFQSFCYYQDIDWQEVARIEDEIEKRTDKPNSDLIAALDALYAPYQKAFTESLGGFPRFYTYNIAVALLDHLDLDDPALGTGKTFAKLSVTVKDKTVDLSDRCSIQFVPWAGSPPPNDLLERIGGPIAMGMYVTANGSFATPGPIRYRTTQDITITDIDFWNCDTAQLISVEFTSQTTGINQKWDGKTPIEIAAGETVELMVKAEDPLLADMIAASFDRILALHYTAQGAQYTNIYNMHFSMRNDPFTLYAHAQDALVMERVRQPAE